MKKNDLVYICSPLSAPTEQGIRKNMEKAAYYAGLVSGVTGCRAIAPHSFLPEYLDDNIPDERILGIKLGAELLKASDMMWLIGTKITKGMKYELEIAKKMCIPIRCYDEKLNRITPDTLSIDDRVNAEFLAELKGANIV